MDLVVNLHLLKRCNYHCGHCFAHFDSAEPLSVDGWKAVIDNIALDRRVVRFNLAGGEPLLFPELYELIGYIHQKSIDVSIITNGSLLKEELLRMGTISMIGVSIDSFQESTQRKMGRCQHNGLALSKSDYVKLCGSIQENGISLKINTVVSALNLNEDFSPIKQIAPNRWKIFKMQVLKTKDFDNTPLRVNKKEFDGFTERQRRLGIDFIEESDMENAYILVDPSGNLVDNTGGRYRAVGNLLTESFEQCLQKLPFNEALYRTRY
jgi:radical S-adenosyl methionine domain-containing protein 2